MNVDRNNFAGILVGLVLPAAQSLVTGVLLFFVAWPVSSVVWEYARFEGIYMPGSPILFATAVGSGTAFLMWLYLRSRWHQALEMLLGVDLNQDGIVGGSEGVHYIDTPDDYAEPLPPEQVVTETKNVKVFVHEDNHTKIFNVPVEYETLIKVCRLLLQRRVFNYGDFSGPGKLLSRNDFEKLRQELISRAILYRQPGKSSPPALTRPGKATLEALISDSEGSSQPV